jgi:CMP-N-acetylneuraminic acid synthetase
MLKLIGNQMENRQVISIIPARGGSKRLPKKNILALNNKLLVEHSIDFAKSNLDIVDKIVVSTDDEEIKQVALKNNIEVIDRPFELAADKASTISVLKHVLETIDGHYDEVILLQPTNPCRPKNLLQMAYKVYLESNVDSLMTVSSSDKKLGKIIDDAFIPYNYTMGQRSQDLEPLYYENGLLYITRASLIKENIIFNEKSIPFIVNHKFAEIDIDTQEDFDYAEFVLKNYNEE